MQDNLKLEKEEIFEILVSVIAISIAFSLLFSGGIGGIPKILRNLDEFLLLTFFSIVTAGTGFIFHEIAHKVSAIFYGAYARFKMWTNGLAFMMITSLFGFLFAAPGAVYIYSKNITQKQNGIISLAGPVTNIIIALAFVALSLTNEITVYLSIIGGSISIWQFGASINVMLALLNMIPVFPLDGSKIFNWNKVVWGAFVGIVALVAFLIENVLLVEGFFLDIVMMAFFMLLLAMFISNLLFKRG
ncbi:MAG TPA: site-2 protease family protein [Candidatus Bilamarchaeaceae archaeon]|nr:site-2 protease family protein [Candidatus Bilamarchaeaceae archaeon]